MHLSQYARFFFSVIMPEHRYKKTIYALFLLLIVSSGLVKAQSPTISYPVAAEDITRGYSHSYLTVHMVFNGVCTGSNTVRIAFPASVTYLPGSVSKTAGSPAVTIAESSIADLSRPEFALSGISAIGDTITFRVARRADCGSLATAKDTIFFIAGSGCSSTSEISGSVNTYNILAPSLSILPPAATTGAVIGTLTGRDITVTNGGNGALDTLYFYIVYSGGGVQNTDITGAITVNGAGFTPVAASGDTLFYQLFGSTLFGGDAVLTSGESVTIDDSVRVVKCDPSTLYGASWGSSANRLCQTGTASHLISMATGVPNFNTMTGTRIGYVDKCTPFDFTLAMTNNGSGNPNAAGMYDMRVRIGEHYSTSVALQTVDTNLFMWSDVRINGMPLPAANVYWSGLYMYVELNNLFSSDPDAAGSGLEDLDGDGYYDDLAAGQTFTLRITQTFKCNLPCGYNRIHQTTGATMEYRTMCAGGTGTRLLSGNVSSGIGYIYESAFDGVAYIPANILDATPFRFQAKAAYYINNSHYDNANTRYRWKIALAPGFSVSGTGDPAYGITPVTYTMLSGGLSGIDTLVYTSSSNNLDSFSVNLVYNCGTYGSKSIYYALEKIDNILTGCTCGARLFCDEITTTTFCPNPCAAGPSNFIPVVRRADGSLGWTDHTLATRQSASAISAYDLSKALYLDTLWVQSSARQNNTADNLHLELTLGKTGSSIDKLTPVNAISQFYRGGALVLTCTTSVASMAASTSDIQAIDFDLSTCVSALPGTTLLAGDSIYTVAAYVVSTNAGLPQNDIQSGSRNIYYNINDSGGRDYCFDPVPEMYLVGTILQNADNAYTATGCNQSTLGGSTNYLARRFNTSGTNYANEYRPVMYIDSVVATLPAGYDLVNAYYQPVNGGLTINPIVPGSVVGNVYTYVNPGTWVAPRLTVTNAYGAYIPFTVVPTCATVNNELINFKVYIRDYYYAYAGNPTPPGLAYELTQPVTGGGKNRNISYITANKPDIVLADQTGEVQAVSSTHSWVLRMSNTGLSTAPYAWIAIPANSGITISQVQDMSTSSVISPIGYAGGQWYQLSSSGIGSGAFRDYRISFSYTSCDRDSIKVYGGWNCASFPASPDAYACGRDSLFLKMNPLPSQIQLSVERQPGAGASVPLCVQDSTIIIVNSAQAANLVQPYLTFYPPSGLSLVTPIRVEYPRASGNYQSATVTPIGGGGYQIDLSAHSGIGSTGILGTTNASPSYAPLGGDRQARVIVNFTTDCNYTSGTALRFNAYGSRPCGLSAVDNGLTSTTTALRITGATAPGSAGVSLDMGSVGSLGCGATATLSLNTVPTGVATVTGDTLVYTLPAGLLYAGNFVRGTNCAGCEITTASGSGGTNVVKVKLETGVSSGNSLRYSFDVRPDGGGCGSVQVEGAFKRDIAPLSCGGVPCASSSVIIANGTSPAITLLKPGLILNAVQKLDDSATWVMGGWLNIVRVRYTNSGSLAYTGGSDTIEFFCSSTSPTPFFKAPLTKSLAIGAADSDTYAIYIPSSACLAGNFVETRIQTTTSSGTPQCLCSSSLFSASAPLPLGLLNFRVQNDVCAVRLTWAYTARADEDMQVLRIQRSADGRVYESVGELQPGATDYIDVTPYAGQWLYRVQAVYKGGRSEYGPAMLTHTRNCAGNNVQVYPNPARTVLFVVLQGNSLENRYELIDALGRKVLQGDLMQNQNNRIETENLPAGAYLIRIFNDGEVISRQLQILK